MGPWQAFMAGLRWFPRLFYVHGVSYFQSAVPTTTFSWHQVDYSPTWRLHFSLDGIVGQ
jgi:hypothetical protein